MILGRETYEGLAAFWPNQDGEYAELDNPIPKYVASLTIKEPLTWNSQLLGTDPAEEVAAWPSRKPQGFSAHQTRQRRYAAHYGSRVPSTAATAASQLADGRYQCGNAIVEIGTAVCLVSLRDRRMYRADKHTGGFTDREVRTGWCVRGAGKAVLV